METGRITYIYRKHLNMRKQGFLEIIRNKAPYPTVYVDGLAKEIDHIHGENIVTKDGFEYNYRHVSRKFYTSDLPVRIYEAIKNDLLQEYQFGQEKLETMMVRLSDQYGITQSAVKRINEQLTIADMQEYKNNQNG